MIRLDLILAAIAHGLFDASLTPNVKVASPIPWITGVTRCVHCSADAQPSFTARRPGRT
jgi:hypothetical protein